MPSFPESDALTLWLGLALVFAIEALVVGRLLAKVWAVRAGVIVTPADLLADGGLQTNATASGRAAEHWGDRAAGRAQVRRIAVK